MFTLEIYGFTVAVDHGEATEASADGGAEMLLQRAGSPKTVGVQLR